jgi:uncharacterized membrane protein
MFKEIGGNNQKSSQNHVFKSRGKRTHGKILKDIRTICYLRKKMVTMKAFAGAELGLGILIVLISLAWCYVIPKESITYLYWAVIGLGVIVIIVAAAALATKTKHQM